MPGLRRLDQVLVARGLVESRARAQILIAEGKVEVGGIVVTKAASMVAEGTSVAIAQADSPFVSRGGIKLEHALSTFEIDVSGMVCLDVGASTGGFTHCLLLRGARFVHAVDVGYGQLHWSLRTDPRVGVHERLHIKDVTRELLDPFPELVVMDVSFISILKVLPWLAALLPKGTRVVTLIKPQFEVGRGKVGKGGVVTDEALREQTVSGIMTAVAGLGCTDSQGPTTSPITGPAGNVEYLATFKL
ncbi:TlyA family RNA methyltransferase [Myxococcota bacterium]|jgi:23S rRNA (cytidine1920-2'-O)/16S rRNA (cytidine1409-2'-O)-methyltransferase|nr:TlyA family RNA methyltransferase [Myxococcota bacterium]MBU1413804.1 TlyA family RNA methyltransferase [Myxococcota bacterium]MBU1510331.1 TlyA family RNA methyltransferase [Myxococcota bacterium]PKN20196.1 MAG: TlyA family rRNA (cytidine-2'-O)-methyltransferase [Deltaproteobacteria bacterium HGW-Deltaproteobacteria-22]